VVESAQREVYFELPIPNIRVETALIQREAKIREEVTLLVLTLLTNARLMMDVK